MSDSIEPQTLQLAIPKQESIKQPEEVLVRVENLSKKFCRSLKRSLWYGVKDMVGEVVGGSNRDTLRKDEFWAVKDVNFELRRGECLGLIGHNGAGKSTLLKMLNGLIKPDQGRIEMNGRVGALIELGAGFNPVLTGRENVYINGQILGFTKKEIDARYDAIVEFAELHDFMEMPVQNYSSGMKVRLGFAVAAQMEPDILIIDEVLAVGDIGFRLKCFNVIDHLIESCCVIFVSHSMQQISRLCTHTLMLSEGKVKFLGENVSQAIDIYYSDMKKAKGALAFQRTEGEVVILKTHINNNYDELEIVKRLDDLIFGFQIDISGYLKDAVAAITIYDNEQRPVGICFSEKRLNEFRVVERYNKRVIIEAQVKLKRINLSKGLYSVTFILSETESSKPVIRVNAIKMFQVTSTRDVWPTLELEGEWV
uniref:ABC transporter ATP-binding protein n=1 Tax=Roseihalotalea indica TaxID=2867963 RepID=A0AA49GT55_9BACT|nr:ABC transporter ATP-binding protein [Tunicatimonas sp. TK19036]